MIEPTLLENCRHQAVAVLDQMYIPTFQGMFVAWRRMSLTKQNKNRWYFYCLELFLFII